MDIAFTKFEKELIDMLLAGEDAVLSLLRRQFSGATIHSRQQTGEGFYLLFDVQEEMPRVVDELPSVKPDFCFGDVDAIINGLRNGAGFFDLGEKRLPETTGRIYIWRKVDT
jgi:hypothetical protein